MRTREVICFNTRGRRRLQFNGIKVSKYLKKKQIVEYIGIGHDDHMSIDVIDIYPSYLPILKAALKNDGVTVRTSDE